MDETMADTDDEGSASAATAASATATPTATDSDANAVNPRKRRGRGAAKANEEMYKNEFVILDELYVSSSGKKYGSKMGLCKHCEEAKNDFEARKPNVIVGKPQSKKIHMTARDCKSHLNKCRYYRLSQSTPIPQQEPVTLDTSISSIDSLMAYGTAAAAPASSLKQPPAPPSRKNKQASMLSFGVPKPNNSERDLILERLTEMMADCALSFSIAERPSFLRFVNALRPGAATSITGRDDMRRRMSAMGRKSRENMLESIMTAVKTGRRVGVGIDGWNGINKEHVDGVTLRVGSFVFPYQCLAAGSDHDGCRVARGWEAIFVIINSQGIVFHYFVSDDAGQCGRARRILSLRHPHILFLKCWAHQLNLMVKHLLGIAEFEETAKSANAIATAFSKSSSKWLPKLMEILEQVYGDNIRNKATSIMGLGETRWNSSQACFASLLRVRKGLMVFHLTHNDAAKYPAAFEVMGANSNFWTKLEEAELVIRPFCDASFLLQREVSSMAHVLLVLLNLANHLSSFCGGDSYAAEMLADIEKRWKSTENHLFFLAFAFHPAFRVTSREILRASLQNHGNWGGGHNPLSTARLTHAARFYFQKFKLHGNCDAAQRGRKLSNLQRQVNSYLRMPGYLNLDYHNGTDPYEWWDYHSEEYNEITILAQFLLDAPVQSADVERIFKDFTGFLTKKRNRLGRDMMFDSTCVKHELKRKYPNDALTKTGAARKSKNRYVNPKEYTKARDDDNGGDAVGNDNGGGRDDADVAVVEEPDGDGDSSGEEDNGNDGGTGTGDGDGGFDALLASMGEIMDDDDEEDVWEGDSDEEEEGKEEVVEDDTDTGYDDGRLPNEHPPESVSEQDREEIPDEDNKRYPQEDAAYFRRKRYCRKDKYTLVLMLAGGSINLPSTMSAFNT